MKKTTCLIGLLLVSTSILAHDSRICIDDVCVDNDTLQTAITLDAIKSDCLIALDELLPDEDMAVNDKDLEQCVISRWVKKSSVIDFGE